MVAFISNIPPWVVICVVIGAIIATEGVYEALGGNQ